MKVKTKKFEFNVGFSPTRLTLKKYELPKLIIDSEGNEQFEAEELLAWILDYSRREGIWVAIAQNDFDHAMQNAFHLWEKKKRILKSNHLKKLKAYREKTNYFWMCIITLGIYAYKHKRPREPELDEVPLKDIDSILLDNHTADFLKKFQDAFDYLSKNGYLRIRPISGELYIYPTEKSIEDIKKSL